MGAPFWFDILNKVMVFRSTVKPKSAQPEPAPKKDTPPTETVLTIPTAIRVQELVPAAMTDADLDDALFEPHEWDDRDERGLL